MSKVADLSGTDIENVEYDHLKGLILADPCFYESKYIDIILGAGEFAKIVISGLIKGKPNEPIAQYTEFGWIVSGETSKKCKANKTVVSLISDVDLDSKINELFEPHTFEINECDDNKLSEEEEMCERHYEQTHRRLPSGRYVVRIPFKNNLSAPELGNSRRKALACFFQLEKFFKMNPKFKEAYMDFINKYVADGHMEVAGDTSNMVNYIPHLAVIREDSTTTKLRVV